MIYVEDNLLKKTLKLNTIKVPFLHGHFGNTSTRKKYMNLECFILQEDIVNTNYPLHWLTFNIDYSLSKKQAKTVSFEVMTKYWTRGSPCSKPCDK